MTAIVNALLFVIYYAITIPVCLLVLIFWLIRLVITVAVMVFVMLLDAWGRGTKSSRAMNVIERVKDIGPDTVKTLLSYRKVESDEGGASRGDFLYELAYTILFLTAIVLAVVFRGYMEAFGRAIEIPSEVFSTGGIAAKLGLAYVVSSFLLGAVLIFQMRDKLEGAGDKSGRGEGMLRTLFIPIHLMLSGAVLVFIVYATVRNMA